MRKIAIISILSFMMISCAESFYFARINHKNKEGKRQGLWINYWDDAETIPMSKNWYKDGKEGWNTKTYHSNGKLAVKFKLRADRIKVKYYDTTRQLSHKGWAKFIITEEDIHYYWHGEWKYFDQNRKLRKKVLYQNGDVDSVLINNESSGR